MSVSTSTDSAPISTATCLEMRSPSATWTRGTVKLMSVVPSCDTFWTIMSTLTPASARDPKRVAATPGRSGTRFTVSFASERSWAMPLTIACSIVDSRTQVPSPSWNEDRTWIGISKRRPNSTARDMRTLAPPADNSSISSKGTSSSLVASGTILGSAVKTPSTSV